MRYTSTLLGGHVSVGVPGPAKAVADATALLLRDTALVSGRVGG
jgi:hypothetical protein